MRGRIGWVGLAAVIVAVMVAHLAWTAAAIVGMTHTGPATTPTAVAIVLGAAVWRDRPSPVFAARIDYTLELLAAGHVEAILFTGGLGGNDRLAESTAAAGYAIEHGAAPAALWCETSSWTTWGNLSGARLLLAQQGWKNATIVSDPFHLYRAGLMARDLGINAQLAPTPYTRYATWRSQWPFFVRELFFVYQYRVQRLLPWQVDTPTAAEIGRCDR